VKKFISGICQDLTIDQYSKLLNPNELDLLSTNFNDDLITHLANICLEKRAKNSVPPDNVEQYLGKRTKNTRYDPLNAETNAEKRAKNSNSVASDEPGSSKCAKNALEHVEERLEEGGKISNLTDFVPPANATLQFVSKFEMEEIKKFVEDKSNQHLYDPKACRLRDSTDVNVPKLLINSFCHPYNIRNVRENVLMQLNR